MSGWTWDHAGGRPMRRLTVGGASEAPDIVVVPGLGACGYLRPLVDACAAWTRVHLLDVPGFGDRRTAHLPSTLADVKNVVQAWLEDVPAAPVILLGHSTGAQAVLRVATSAPSMIGLLVLAAPTFPPELRSWRGLVAPALQCILREPMAEVAAVAPYYLRGRSRVGTLLRSALADRPEAAVVHLRRPAVVLRGERDPLTTNRWAAELAGGQPFVTLPGAHNFPFTHPAETSAAVREAATAYEPRIRRTTTP